MLEEILGEIISILDEHNEELWSKKLQESLRRIQAGDYSGVGLLKTLYGGMGSFSDLTIQPSTRKGEIEFTQKQIKANNQLELLRGNAWALANEIKYEN